MNFNLVQNLVQNSANFGVGLEMALHTRFPFTSQRKQMNTLIWRNVFECDIYTLRSIFEEIKNENRARYRPVVFSSKNKKNKKISKRITIFEI